MQQAIVAQADTCFLSYSRADEDFALRLADDLRSLGVEMWVDRLNIRPSEHWDRAIERAIRGCCRVVAVLSPRAVASENVADEISLAINSGKPVIPVMMEPCHLPLRLTRMHLIDATRGYHAALKQCLAEIKDGRTSPTSANDVDAPCALADPDILAVVKEQLTGFIGPIAEILVNRAASKTASAEALYRELAIHIPNEADRARFLLWIPQNLTPSGDAAPPAATLEVADAGSIDPGDVERIAEVLTSYLGPIATLVTKRESRASRSVGDLLRRIASRLRSEHDRLDFLCRLEGQSGAKERPLPGN
jgi:TIR domain